MQIHSRCQGSRNWRQTSLYLVVALALFSCSLSLASTSPVPQAVFRAGHQGQQHSMNNGPFTILDILGERPEFSKLLELVQKDKDLMDLLADPATQSTLFAPTNDAFDSVSDIDYPTRDVLMYHVADSVYNSSRLHGEHVIKSLYESKGLNNAAQLLRISLEQPGIPSTTIRSSFWRDEPIWIADLQEDIDDRTEAQESSLYVNRAKVTVPDLLAQSGSIVHGVSRIIRPPGETILDEIERRGMHFKHLIKAWSETGVDAHIRDGKAITLFAAHDKAWKALPKKLLKWLFSNKGREHLKIFTMYQIGNKALYTPEIFNKTHEDGTPGDDYHEVVLQTLLHSPRYQLSILGKARKTDATEAASHRRIEYKPKGLTDLVATLLEDPMHSKPKNKTGHHHPHDDPDHPHHHPHRGGKHHGHRHHRHHRGHPPHRGDGDEGGDPKVPHPHPHPTPRRDEIVVNKRAHVMHGYENWIAGNGVIHVIDKVLMPPRSEGCEKMTALECSAWETMWDLANVGLDAVVEDAKAWYEDLSLFGTEEEEKGHQSRFFAIEDEDENEDVEEETFAYAFL